MIDSLVYIEKLKALTIASPPVFTYLYNPNNGILLFKDHLWTIEV